MNCTLSFESYCKHCGNCTSFCAMMIPADLDETIIATLVDERSIDACYSCYAIIESKEDDIVAARLEELKKS